jgi:deazaflavin-dependent oxidoreductase (nitroreductase family)
MTDDAGEHAATSEHDRAGEHDRAMEFSSRGNTRWIVLRGDKGRAIDRVVLRLTGRSIITWQYSRAGGNPYQPTLLLTTIGRRTGERRERALPYYPDGERMVVIGSNGGGPRDPDWVFNVRANPAAWVRVGRRSRPVLAHVAEGEERARLFDQITAGRDSLSRYQQRASTYGRTVPLVVLTPRAPTG